MNILSNDADTSSCVVVDIGSTSIKIAVGSPLSGVPLFVLKRWHTPVANTTGDRHEVDVMEILSIVRRGLADICAEYPTITTLAVSTQMHGSVFTDGENCPVSPFFTWQDRRALRRGKQSLVGLMSEPQWATEWKTAGVRPRAGLGALSAAEWRRQNPQAPVKRIHTMGSFLAAHLAKVFVTHVTNAAALGIWNLMEGSWNSALVEALGLADVELPTVTQEYQPIGTVSLGLSNLRLFPDLGDQQAAALSVWNGQGDEAFLSMGTAGILARPATEISPDQMVETRPFWDGCFLHTVTKLPGGRHSDALDAMINSVRTDGADKAHLLTSAQSLLQPGFSETTDLHVGEDKQAGKLLVSVSLGKNYCAGDLARAFYQFMRREYLDAWLRLNRHRTVNAIHLNGGAANPWLARFFSTLLEAQTVLSTAPDLTVTGVFAAIRLSSKGVKNVT